MVSSCALMPDGPRTDMPEKRQQADGDITLLRYDMRHFSFKMPNPLPLTDIFRCNIRSYVIISDKFSRPYILYILLDNGSCVKFRSITYTISTRIEVGSLLIELEEKAPPDQELFEIPVDFQDCVRLDQLNMTVNDSYIECGLAMIGKSGAQIIVVPGVMPYSIHIESPFFTDSFEPEFDLSEYRRMSLR